MGFLSVSGLAYAHPGGQLLLDDVSFRVGAGDHAGLIGMNGIGKTTLLRILAGELEAVEGSVQVGGEMVFMPQDVGLDDGRQTVRDLFVRFAPTALRRAGLALLDAERRLHEGDTAAGAELGHLIGEWSDLGGYQLEGKWDATTRRVLRQPLVAAGDRLTGELSGGERKQLVLDLVFSSDAEVVLLDEPDNYLDIPAKNWLEALLRSSAKTVLMVTHDRELLAASTNRIITLEPNATWVHGESYRTYLAARDHRQSLLAADLKRWQDEERRLFRYYKLLKQRAAISDGNAAKADAAETRWKRFVEAGPPEAPAPEQRVGMRLAGGDSARRVLTLKHVALDGLIDPMADEVHFGERVGLVGSNGSGKSHLLRILAGLGQPTSGELLVGNRVSAGLFTQFNRRADFAGRTPLELVVRLLTEEQRSMAALARYGLAAAARRPYETLSGGQKARLEILTLEIEGHNLLLLDEPTDNLDLDSAVALEAALALFDGTIVAVSHDRAFLRSMTRFWLLEVGGATYEVTDYDTAVTAIAKSAAGVGKRAKPLSHQPQSIVAGS